MEGGVLAFVVHAYTRHFLAFGDGLGSCFRHPAPGVVTCHSLAYCSRILFRSSPNVIYNLHACFQGKDLAFVF